MKTQTSVVVLSGGVDSAVALYLAKQQGLVAHAISVNYGQRHSKELKYAETLAQATNTAHTIVDLTSVKALLPGSALTDKTIAVPHGHYADPIMQATVVPNRNMMLIAIAVAAAAANKATRVVYGAHAGDAPIYPDCRLQFIDAMKRVCKLAWYEEIELEAPFVNNTKAEIVKLGDTLGVPWADTWSCYEGNQLHCGACGTCVERREAFKMANVLDPTNYETEAAL